MSDAINFAKLEALVAENKDLADVGFLGQTPPMMSSAVLLRI